MFHHCSLFFKPRLCAVAVSSPKGVTATCARHSDSVTRLPGLGLGWGWCFTNQRNGFLIGPTHPVLEGVADLISTEPR